MTAARRLVFYFALDFFTTVLAGHGLDVGTSSRRESDGDDGVAGLSTPWIIAAGFLALITAGVLVWLNPGARNRLMAVSWKAAAPKALIAVMIVAPLLAWTATAGGGDAENLMVERSTALTGAPELLISLGEDDLNKLKTTGGKKIVRVECLDSEEKLVIEAKKNWPFVYERGYDYPHAHVLATREQVRRAESCRLGGTRVDLEAKVEGRLPR
jgi:hypothetical protein